MNCQQDWNPNMVCQNNPSLCMLFWRNEDGEVYTHHRLVCKLCADVYARDPHFYQYEGIVSGLTSSR